MKRYILLAVAFLFIATPGPVFAFSDIDTDPNAAKILHLKEKGFLKGESVHRFNPKGTMTNATGTSAIVSTLELSLAKFSFVKAPMATDFFIHLKNDAWYANAFVIAHLNGIDIPDDVRASDRMTREQFAHYVLQGIHARDHHTFTEIHFKIKDASHITPAYANSVQMLLNGGIGLLDADGSFRPKDLITRSEAAGWLFDALQLVSKGNQLPEMPLSPLSDISYDLTSLHNEVNQITIKANVPHPGYGINVHSIEFVDDEARIFIEPTLPYPDRFFPQVVTEVHVKTYVDAQYKPVIEELPGRIPGGGGKLK